MAEIHESLQFALDRRGPVTKVREAGSEEMRRLREILPRPLADFVEIKGYCSFNDGLFTMCNPDEFRPILALVFGADPQFNHNDCHVIGYSSFGILYCWHQEYWDFEIYLPESGVYVMALTRPDFTPKISPERAAAGMFPDRIGADFLDFAGEPMYDRCEAMHGRLEPGECYGFFPALAVVGVGSPFRRVENIQRVKAMEHFAILAQMGDFHLMKTVPGGVAPVRRIG